MSDDPVLAAIAKLGADLREDMRKLRDDLVGMINVGNERILDRLSLLEGEVRNLRSEHSVTRDFVTKLPATVLGVIEQPLLRRITNVEDRVSKIEGKAP